MKCSISNIANVISESIPNPAESEFDIFVGLEHYDSGEVKVTRYGSTQNLVTAVKVFRKGDILLARRNVYLKRAGLVDFDGVTSGDSIVLRVKDDLSSLSLQSEDIRMYLPFVLNTEEFWNYAEKYSDGTMSKRLSPKTLLQYEFDIPDDVTEKNRLLWQAYKTKESYKAMILATDEMVKSQFIEMFGNPVTNPMGWSTKPLCQVAPESPSNTKMKGRVWVLNLDMIESNSGCIINKVFEDSDDLNSVAAFDEGNVLFSKLRPYLNKVTIPDGKGYATTELVPLRPHTDELRQHFLSFLLRTDEFVKYADGIATGTKMPRMPMTALREFKCILPPTELQDLFCGISKQADKSKFELKQAIEKVDKVMRALMQ